MIPFDTRLCEVLEAVMSQEPEQKQLQTLTNAATQLMMQTNKIFESNLHRWSDTKLLMYGLRVSKYKNLTHAFTSIYNGNPTQNILDTGIRDGKLLYNDINTELYPEWERAGKERRGEILQDVLLPHMLFIRFLEKKKNNLSA